jgi:short subunit dehydrogenase-like uncharacterized protein
MAAAGVRSVARSLPMPSSRRFVLYGASGFTGRLLVEEAVARGHRPILAGRSRAKLAPLAEAHGLEAALVSLDDRDELERLAGRAKLVLHAAGPFAQTSEPMLRACLAQKAHYVDITGELPVLENTFAHDRRAKEAGVALMSAAGFDVVPSDCLALHVARRIEKPTRLRIAVAASDQPTPGTVKSALALLPAGGKVRRHGELVEGPLFSPSIVARFGDRERNAVPAPLGDLETAWRTTGIGEIETYLAQPAAMAVALRAAGPLVARAIESPRVRDRLFAAIDARVRGPSEDAMSRARSHVWAAAENAAGDRAESWLEGPESYAWTAKLAWNVAEKIVESGKTGALTPAGAFGPDFVLGDGVRRGDW